MTSALVDVGDESAPDPSTDAGRLTRVRSSADEPVVEEVRRFEDLPLGSAGSRRAIVRWSDGRENAPVTFYADEVLFCEGDHGNSGLMSPRAELHRAAGSVRAPRGT